MASDYNHPRHRRASARTRAIFPTLTPEQIARVTAVGTTRQVRPGELLIEQGDPHAPFLLVRSGALDVVRGTNRGEEHVTATQGTFIGEVTILQDRPSLVAVRVREGGELIQLDRAALRRLMQTDSELSDIFVRAFVLRRLEIIERGSGDTVVVGSAYSAPTLAIREFLSRNGHPYAYVDLDRDAAAQHLLDQLHVRVDEVPVVICRGQLVLRRPTPRQVADCLGFNENVDATRPRDVVIVGAGPGGLAAAVYAASEGLSTLLVEAGAPGGQAGTSSKIENYLGFPTGISGAELTSRAVIQAGKFGAELLVANEAVSLRCGSRPYAVVLDHETVLSARSVVIATGAQYRTLSIENLARFEGTGVYHAATPIEAQLCGAEEVVVVGGGNSAGQAAVFLSGTAGRVHMLIRGSGLSETMSRYLIERIAANPRITLYPRTELTAVAGDASLASVEWRRQTTGEVERRAIRHVFVMTGAAPNARWLNGCVVQDSAGFIKTGGDLTHEDLAASDWPLARAPYIFETSRPGVFAVGDVRAGNLKRVAAAVGEGSTAIHLVHRVLHE